MNEAAHELCECWMRFSSSFCWSVICWPFRFGGGYAADLACAFEDAVAGQNRYDGAERIRL